MRRRRAAKCFGLVVAILLAIEVASAGAIVLFGPKPKVALHAHPTGNHAVVVVAGISNVGNIAAKNVVAELLAEGVHALVVNYAWGKMNTYDIYKAVVSAIKTHNQQAGSAKIESVSILGSSFGGMSAVDMAGYFLQDGLPYGKVGITLDGAICTATNLKWPSWLIQYGGYVVGGVFTTLLKAGPSYLNSSRALEEVEPGLSMAHLRWHHLSIGLFPMPGVAAQVRFIRDYRPPPNVADAVSKVVFVRTPHDPLINNQGAADCWREVFPDMEVITPAWGENRHAPLAEEPALQAQYAALTFP